MIALDRFVLQHVAPLGGVKIIESVHAMAEPPARPRTDDMVAMVEHLRQLGQIRRRPAAFQTPAGLIVHPEIMKRIRARVSTKLDDIAMQAFTGGLPT